ncbi:MAG: FAA hydrolase family protein [Betaproteobacteria bacterium]|nr:FAA hydrolase family protein [Betaproteobacteria bacterium]MSQ89076.1 FAA hydrolase family protein [Betaproteobacteria bacterium]
MKLCRFVYDQQAPLGADRLGLVEGDEVLDVSGALEAIPAQRWPIAPGDPLIMNLERVTARVHALTASAPRHQLSAVKLRSPVANPTKIVNAPINYQAHIDEAKTDQGIAHGRDMSKGIWDWGLFLKATSALIGPGEDIRLRFPQRRNDHEIELAVIIGKQCNHVKKEDALQYVAGYAIGLDMTIRGPELQCFRKSPDTYAVCGPWLVTKDEIPEPNNLDLSLRVNGELRQHSNTKRLVYNVERLIEYATSFYTLHPGDLIFTGTPEGVGPVQPGDLISAEIERIGRFEIRVADTYDQ